MTEKFTPGEWTVHEFYHEYSKQSLYNIYWGKDGEEVAERVYSKADAHLMSASKELYEELDRCDDLLRDVILRIPQLSGLVRVIQQQLEANKKAILKARGEE